VPAGCQRLIPPWLRFLRLAWGFLPWLAGLFYGCRIYWYQMWRPMFASIALAILSTSPTLTPILSLSGEINTRSVGPLVAFFQDAGKRRLPRVVLEIDSMGGMDDAGFTLILAMNYARANDVHITCIAQHAYSMAAIVFEAACDTRKLHLDGSLLFHEGAYLILGSEPGARLTKTFLAALADQLNDDDLHMAKLVAPRMGISAEDYMAWIAGHDRYVDAPEALVKGYIDELITPT
jgi:ATP-dependent protease ClpP protease subunit